MIKGYLIGLLTYEHQPLINDKEQRKTAAVSKFAVFWSVVRLRGVHVHIVDMQNVIVSRRRRRPRPPCGIGRQMPKSIFGQLMCLMF